MKVVIVSLFIALLLMLAGCDGESSDSKSGKAEDLALKDELTTVGEMPAMLEEGLTSEEKDELMSQILPSDPDGDDVTPGERFLELVEQAKDGDPEAQNGLGVMYYTGEAVSENAAGEVLDNDPGLAAGWFYRAAEQGYADAQFNLGLMYANGEGIEADTSKAVELFQKAAEQGNVDAQNNLAAMYYTGEGVARDVDAAIEWFEKAADQGNADATANLDAIRAESQ
jgi:TPR repeat protein